MPRGVSMGLGGAGAHLALPGCRCGEPGGGLPPAAAGSLLLPGGSGGKFSTSTNTGLSQKHRQPLQGQVCEGAQRPVAELEGSGWLLQGACHLKSPSKLFGGSALPVSPHHATHLCNSETQMGALWRAQVKLFGIDIHTQMQNQWAWSGSVGQGRCLSCPWQTPDRNPILGHQ